MECSCAVDICDYDCEPVVCLTHGVRKAKKTHKCRDCGRDINKGETYNYTKYLFDGKWFNDKACSDCQSAIDRFFPHGGYRELWMEIAEEVSSVEGEIPESCISELSLSAREKLCDIMDEYFDSYDRHQSR